MYIIPAHSHSSSIAVILEVSIYCSSIQSYITYVTISLCNTTEGNYLNSKYDLFLNIPKQVRFVSMLYCGHFSVCFISSLTAEYSF